MRDIGPYTRVERAPDYACRLTRYVDLVTLYLVVSEFLTRIILIIARYATIDYSDPLPHHFGIPTCIDNCSARLASSPGSSQLFNVAR